MKLDSKKLTIPIYLNTKIVLLLRSYETSPKDDYIDLSEYMNIPPDTSDEVLKEDF